jgi:hypothetical protein
LYHFTLTFYSTVTSFAVYLKVRIVDPINSQRRYFMAVQDFSTTRKLKNALIKLSQHLYGKECKVVIQDGIAGMGGEWQLVRTIEVLNKGEPLDLSEVKKLTCNDVDLITFLNDRHILDGNVWVFIHRNDKFPVMRSDRFIYLKDYPDLLSLRYTFECWCPVDNEFKRVKGKENLLVLSDMKMNCLIVPEELAYWHDHHVRESPYYLCDQIVCK